MYYPLIPPPETEFIIKQFKTVNSLNKWLELQHLWDEPTIISHDGTLIVKVEVCTEK